MALEENFITQRRTMRKLVRKLERLKRNIQHPISFLLISLVHHSTRNSCVGRFRTKDIAVRKAENVARKILIKYPKAIIFLTGDEHCKEQEFTGDRIISWVTKRNIRSVALMTKYMDLTISMETGLPLIAHSWDAPCLQLLTAASYENHIKGAKNAYWLQSPALCSPCHKNPREYWGCPSKDNMPVCVWFDEDKIMEKVGEAIGI